MLWALVNTFIRLSAVLLLHRIFSHIEAIRYVTIALVILSLLYGLAALLTTVLLCRPIQAAWDTEAEGVCGDQYAAYAWLECSGLVIDLLILLTPPIPVWGLNTALKRKAGVLLVLSAGGM